MATLKQFCVAKNMSRGDEDKERDLLDEMMSAEDPDDDPCDDNESEE